MPAAGGGTRLGFDVPKALVEVKGAPLFLHALRPFLEMEECVEAVIAVPPEHRDSFENCLSRSSELDRVRIVDGGLTRQSSVSNAFRALSYHSDAVLVHDAARPVIRRPLIERILRALADFPAAVPALPISDTVKRASGDPVRVESTISRRNLYVVQTPQGLRREIANEAYARLATEPFDGTDDVSLVEHFGLGDVRLVEGDPLNIKVTTAADLERVRELLAPLP